MDKVVATSDRMYRLIVHVYPRAFRDEYGEEMAQTMRDQVREAWADRRMLGVIVLWLKVLVDTARSAFVEHLKQRRIVSFGRSGLGYGLATAIGFPLAFVSFSSFFWSGVVWAGDVLGFETANNWLHPTIAGPGFVLAGIGLYGLHRRLEFDSSFSIAAVWVGVALGLLGLAGIYVLPFRHQPYFSVFATYGVPAAFVVLTLGLATMGRTALRTRTFGALSFVPLAVAGSGGLWFVVIMSRFLLPIMGASRDILEASTLLIHVASWFILGVLLWAYPPGDTESVHAT